MGVFFNLFPDQFFRQAQISDCGELIFVTTEEQIETRSYTHFFFGDLLPTIKSNYQTVPYLHSLLEGDHLDVQVIHSTFLTLLKTSCFEFNFMVVMNST